MVIMKIGGGKNINIEGIAKNISALKDDVIIVHGANYCRDEYAEKLGIKKKILTSVSGYSSVFSDKELIDLQMLTYAGLRNKRIVECFQLNGINAIGLSGIDAKVIVGRRNRGIRIRENGKLKIVRDFSGKPVEINKPLLDAILKLKIIPVITVPIIDENGYAINTENDDVVALLNDAFKPEIVVSFIEAPGLLKNHDDSNSSIREITKSELSLWEEETEGRIKRKLHALNKLFVNNNPRVIITDGRSDNPIANIINNIGTLIV